MGSVLPLKPAVSIYAFQSFGAGRFVLSYATPQIYKNYRNELGLIGLCENETTEEMLLEHKFGPAKNLHFRNKAYVLEVKNRHPEKDGVFNNDRIEKIVRKLLEKMIEVQGFDVISDYFKIPNDLVLQQIIASNGKGKTLVLPTNLDLSVPNLTGAIEVLANQTDSAGNKSYTTKELKAAQLQMYKAIIAQQGEAQSTQVRLVTRPAKQNESVKKVLNALELDATEKADSVFDQAHQLREVLSGDEVFMTDSQAYRWDLLSKAGGKAELTSEDRESLRQQLAEHQNAKPTSGG